MLKKISRDVFLMAILSAFICPNACAMEELHEEGEVEARARQIATEARENKEAKEVKEAKEAKEAKAAAEKAAAEKAAAKKAADEKPAKDLAEARAKAKPLKSEENAQQKEFEEQQKAKLGVNERKPGWLHEWIGKKILKNFPKHSDAFLRKLDTKTEAYKPSDFEHGDLPPGKLSGKIGKLSKILFDRLEKIGEKTEEKTFATDKDVKKHIETLNASEDGKKAFDDARADAKQKLINGKVEHDLDQAKHDLVDKYIKEQSLSPEDAKKKVEKEEPDIKKELQEKAAGKVTDKAVVEATNAALKAKLSDEKLEKKVNDFIAKNPKKIEKMLGKKLIEEPERFGVAPEGETPKAKKERTQKAIKAMLADPKQKESLIKELVREDVKANLKKTVMASLEEKVEMIEEKFNKADEKLEKAEAKFDKAEEKLSSTKATVIGVVAGGLLMMVSALVGSLVSKAVSEYYANSDFGTPKGLNLATQSSYGSDKLMPEDQKNMDALEKLATFYSTMDARFKDALSKFDYDNMEFQTVQDVKYAGGVLPAGMAVLFDYKQAGNIAEGLTPVVVRFYPMQIAGNTIDPMTALVGVANLDALELIAALRSCSPYVIFFIKAISLLNTANKKFTAVAQKRTFLSEQMNLLFARLLRTVDDYATRRANSIEPNQEKWESVYVHNPAQCFTLTPKVLRDFIAGLTVDTVDQTGRAAKVSFEQYVMDQFGIFDAAYSIKFEGDVDYHADAAPLDDAALKQRLFAIFTRALNDVLEIEKTLASATAPVKIKDAQGTAQLLDCQKFFTDVTTVASNNLKKVQAKFVDASVEYAADMSDTDNLKEYNSTFKEYMNALGAFTKAAMEFRKKASFYPHEKALGYQPERVFDFVKRECKRAYQQARNKSNFILILTRVFEPFAGNFPFTTKDLLGYAQEPGPVKSPARVVFVGA